MSEAFKREDRYLVMKRSDMLHLSKNDQQRLSQIALRVDGARASSGKRKLNCVVVESDWPEFEPVWKQLEDRVCGSADQLAIAATVNVDLSDDTIADLYWNRGCHLHTPGTDTQHKALIAFARAAIAKAGGAA